MQIGKIAKKNRKSGENPILGIFCPTVEFKIDYVLGFIICEIFPVIRLQDWVSWGIFTVIPGYPRRTNGDSQHLEAGPELQDWLRSELFT